MTDDPPEEQLSQRHLALLVAGAVIVLLFCCCALAVGLWFAGDSILEFLGLAYSSPLGVG